MSVLLERGAVAFLTGEGPVGALHDVARHAVSQLA